MTPADSAATYTTDHVAPHERLAFWHEVVCEVFLKLSVEAQAAPDFAGSAEARQWDDVAISRVVGMPQVVEHGRADPRDDCLVSVQVVGRGTVSQAGREVLLNPGDMALYDATEPYRLGFDERFEQVVLQFPRQALIDRDVSIEHSVARRLGGGSGLTDITTSMACTLARQQGSVPALMRHRLGSQTLDLLAATIADAFGGRYELGRREAQRQLILEYVNTHLDDPDLGVDQVAAAFGRTTRSLQYVFAGAEPLGSTIRRLRLERAAVALANPTYATLTIGRIGAMCGFGDPAAFSRSFRREFGLSPSDVRRQAS